MFNIPTEAQSSHMTSGSKRVAQSLHGRSDPCPAKSQQGRSDPCPANSQQWLPAHACISKGAASRRKRRSQGIARRARACPHGNSSLVNRIRLFLSLYFPESLGRRTEAGAGALARWCGTQPGAVEERCSTSREEAASCAMLCAQTSRVKSGQRGNGIKKE